MITREMLKTAALAKRRAVIERQSASWVPVFADVVLDGEKIGNVTSDGYTNRTWTFYPREDGRREKTGRFVNVLPAWASRATFVNFETYQELLISSGGA